MIKGKRFPKGFAGWKFIKSSNLVLSRWTSRTILTNFSLLLFKNLQSWPIAIVLMHLVVITSGDREQVVQHSCRVDDPCALMYRYESQREKERGHCSPIEISCRSSNLLGCSFCCWVVARVVALVTDRRGSFAELFRFSFGYWGNHVRSVMLVVVCGVHFLFSRRKPGWNFLLSWALHAQSESLTRSSLSKTPFRVREQQWRNI